MDESISFEHWGDSSEEILKSQFPLHLCCRDGDVETLAVLLHDGKHNVYSEDGFYGWTPAHWAAYFGKLKCLIHLLELGMQPDICTIRFKQAPSHIAAFGGHGHCLTWLLHQGASCNMQDYLGETPLHKAARTGSMECISLLVSHGARMGINNNNHHSPSDVAYACGHPECGSYLEEARRHQDAQLLDSSHTMETMEVAEPHLVSTASDAEASFRSPGSSDDILLSNGVSHNYIPVAGRKRSREDCSDDGIKRIRTGDVNVPKTLHDLPVHVNGYEEDSTSAIEHHSVVSMQVGYDSMLVDSIINQYHGS